MNKIKVKCCAPLARHNSATKKGFDPQGNCFRTEEARPFMCETHSLQKMLRFAFKLFKPLPKTLQKDTIRSTMKLHEKTERFLSQTS